MKTIDRRHAVPFALVTSMFLLWGLANNMTDTLLAAFKRIMSMSDTQTSLIQFAFYGSYFCFALPAALFIRRRSFKSGIILGLLLYAAGAMLFLPAARVASYGFYLVAIYVMAGGCSVLETTANPYVMSMGDPRTATRRLNIAQSFNPVGSILGILMSKYFILDDISLYSISGTYAALGLVLLGILVVMLFARMPSGKDDDRSDSVGASFRRLLSNRLYRRGVVAQFFYVGAQIGVWSFTIRLVMQETGRLEAAASSIYLISIIGHCLSRFIYTGLMRWFSPLASPHLRRCDVRPAEHHGRPERRHGLDLHHLAGPHQFLHEPDVPHHLRHRPWRHHARRAPRRLEDRSQRPDHVHPRRRPPHPAPGHGLRPHQHLYLLRRPRLLLRGRDRLRRLCPPLQSHAVASL